MAKREDGSHVVVEKKGAPGYRCTEGDWETSADDSDARDNAKRHERATFGTR